jgi:hypothetical protein
MAIKWCTVRRYDDMTYPAKFKYLVRYKELFQYDDENPCCCNPEIQSVPDEAVFHFRKKDLDSKN